MFVLFYLSYYFLTNSLVSDINECTTNVHNCDVNSFCNNTDGSYNCTCISGYTGNGTSCTGKSSSQMNYQAYASLFRLQAKLGFYCGISNICVELFTCFILILFNNPLLSDINECTTIAHNCDVNAFCNNTDGSHNCTCSSGYAGNGTSCRGKLLS